MDPAASAPALAFACSGSSAPGGAAEPGPRGKSRHDARLAHERDPISASGQTVDPTALPDSETGESRMENCGEEGKGRGEWRAIRVSGTAHDLDAGSAFMLLADRILVCPQGHRSCKRDGESSKRCEASGLETGASLPSKIQA